MQLDSKQIYHLVKKGQSKLCEDIHCPMVLDVISKEGTVAAFCAQAAISDATFYSWLHKSKCFMECYRIASMMARDAWEKRGEDGQYEEGFNLEVWKVQGMSRFGTGKTNRVRIHIDAESNPYEQYKQLVAQAAMGDFTAAEFKQLMETINIGCRAYETFELQKEVDDMRSDLEKMNQNANNIVSITKTA